ncbi:AAA family ATPase [Calidithermus roseus]|uniref:Nuclease SbcCD subunit C n=1 Tax=Calidithermus roseus TaxID=1644118 RepID=A0A399EUX1_9DEIN|nr:SMC family ATPase [Calidithermus roseus]RIH88414.1 Nuclease SbcCD subunit C [Calidithermus roseus]
MRPLKLRVQGFGSYLEPQEVQFDDVELFAITGPTGAGKSTLLDAITFALYRETPRAGAKGHNSLRHPAAEQAKVELEFSLPDPAGPQTWRVVRVIGKENQSRLEYLERGDWRTHPASEKVSALNNQLLVLMGGMDFSTFTRAILLPQGQFDLFLRGVPKERRELLMKLYGLERLRDMRERVGEHLKEAREKLGRLEGELQGLGEAEEGRLEAMREEIRQLEAEEVRLTREAERAQRALAEAEKRYEKFNELDGLRRRQRNWEGEQEEMGRLRERLERADQAERVWPQVEGVEVARKEAETALADLARWQKGLERLRAEVEGLRERCDPAALEAAKGELARLPVLEAMETRLTRYGGSLSLSRPDPLPFDEDRLETLRESERRWGELKKLEAQLARLEGELAKEQSRLEERQAEKTRLEADLERLKDEGQEAARLHEQAKTALEQAQRKAGVLAHRHLLRAGEACPLCEQAVAVLPPPREMPDLERLGLELARAEQQLQELRNAFQEKRGSLKTLAQSLPEEQERLSARLRERGRLAGEVEQLRSGLSGSPEALEDERTRMLAGLAEEIRQATGGEGVGRFKAGLQKRVAELQAAQERLAEAEARLAEAERQLTAQAQVLQERQRALERLETSLALLLGETGFDGLEAVRAARLSAAERQALQQRRQEHEREGIAIAEGLRRLERELEGLEPVDEASVRLQREALEALRQGARAAHGRAEGLKADLKRAEDQLRRRRELEAQQAKLVREVDVWERLERDLRGDRFQDFLLERYQSGLLQRASELMNELSQGRYAFRLEDSEYAVEDRWTESVRTVRTLSGGESFLASLSLALSLSEHLSKGRMGALFLDEGFGTLDVETLEQVAGVLEALPTRGRLVGVVTHVEALAERLPARLRVEKSPAGSRIRWSDD